MRGKEELGNYGRDREVEGKVEGEVDGEGRVAREGERREGRLADKEVKERGIK